MIELLKNAALQGRREGGGKGANLPQGPNLIGGPPIWAKF